MFAKTWNRAAAGATAAAIAISTTLAVAPQEAQAQTSAPTMGQCVAPAVLQGQLRNQEQKFAFSGTQYGIFTAKDNKPSTYEVGISFTSKPDGKNGFVVQECRNDFGKATGQSRAQMQLTNIRVYPDTLEKPLPEMFVKAKDSDAEKACAKWDVGNCGAHNKVINDGYSNGYRIVLQGFNAEANQIISISKKGQDAVMIATDASTGASTGMAAMKNVDYSAFVKTVGYSIPVQAAQVAALTQQSVALK